LVAIEEGIEGFGGFQGLAGLNPNPGDIELQAQLKGRIQGLGALEGFAELAERKFVFPVLFSLRRSLTDELRSLARLNFASLKKMKANQD
jgi:hypothetical protein